MTTWQIIESELIEWLQAYDGPRFHAVLSDPPYALISITKRFGKDGSAPAQKGSDGRFSRLSKGFMSQKWDGFDSLEHYQTWVSEWARLLIEKALHPGAVCLFFGGTRTYHHLGVGLERGGFEIMDCLMWLHGQGFPKSHDISKGLDKIAPRRGLFESFAAHFRDRAKKTDLTSADISGHILEKYKNFETAKASVDHFLSGRRVPSRVVFDVLKPLLRLSDEWDALIGRDEAEREVIETRTDSGKRMLNFLPTEETEFDITVPSTKSAETWDGYGTALKPAWEPIFLCRAPRGDKTFAQLATEFGTGALNIDGTRIGMEQIRIHGYKGDSFSQSYKEKGTRPELDEYRGASGRWPANFILSHTDECVKVGEFEVEGRVINRFKQGMMPFGGAEGEEYETEEMPPETVERWACVPSCPVRMLDDQAGERKTGDIKPHVNQGSWKQSSENITGSHMGDTGGPSRFFYTAKASRSEKDKGLEHFWWKRTDDGFERISLSEYEQLDKRERAHGCIHPTVKPLELLRYLSTLVLPPKQEGKTRRILIPFSGSGSEMIGAVQAGWNKVVGIEMERNYIKMAEARLTANVGMF